jgi:hypothetical protein
MHSYALLSPCTIPCILSHASYPMHSCRHADQHAATDETALWVSRVDLYLNKYSLVCAPCTICCADQHAATDETALWVSRVDLCFTAEDPFVFARRHVDAHANRGHAESLLRYNLYIDCMPTEDIPPLSTEQVRCNNDLRLLNNLWNSVHGAGEGCGWRSITSWALH